MLKLILDNGAGASLLHVVTIFHHLGIVNWLLVCTFDH